MTHINIKYLRFWNDFVIKRKKVPVDTPEWKTLHNKGTKQNRLAHYTGDLKLIVIKFKSRSWQQNFILKRLISDVQ